MASRTGQQRRYWRMAKIEQPLDQSQGERVRRGIYNVSLIRSWSCTSH